MMTILITDAVISKGFGDAPTIRFFNEGQAAGFRVGQSVYDKNAENKTRWVNLNVVAFDDLVDQIRRMKLQEYSHINIVGTFDMKPGVDKETGEVKAWPTIRAMKIEYAASAGGRQRAESAETKPAEPKEPEPVSPEQLPGFTGFEPLGGSNPYYGK